MMLMVIVVVVLIVMALLVATVGKLYQQGLLPSGAWPTVQLFNNLFAFISRFHPVTFEID